MEAHIFALIFLCLIYTVDTADESRLIQQLQLGIKARITLYYGVTDIKDLTTNETTLLLFNEKADYELRHKFQSSALGIISCDNERRIANFTSLLFALKKTLKERRPTDLMFVANSSSIESRYWLFNWCWRNGFYNVLLLNRATDKLYSFFPFPDIRIENITIKDYLEKRNNWRDLKGHKIRTAAGNHPPRAMVYRKQGKVQFSGIIPHYLKTFAEHYNATIEVVLMPRFENYNIFDCAAAILRKTVHICADYLMMGYNFSIEKPWVVSFTKLLVPFAQSAPRFRYFLTPFSDSVWIFIGLTVVYITLTLSLTQYRRMSVWNFGYYFLQVLSSILFITFNLRGLQGRSKFVIHALLVIFGFIISNFYLAMLSTLLTTNIYERQIETLEDVRAHNLTLIISDFDKDVFEKYGGEDLLALRTLHVDKNEQDKYFFNLDPQFVYLKVKDKLDFYLYQQKYMIRPRMKTLDKNFLSVLGGMPVVENWPLLELYNVYKQRIFEAGLPEYFKGYIQREAVNEAILKKFSTEHYTVSPLSMEYFEMPAILLGCGYIFALLSFIFEQLKR